MTLQGVVPPATTPFGPDGEIDYTAVKQQVNWLIENGVHGVAMGGSTGEGQALDVDEIRALIGTSVEAAEGRIPVIAGIIVDSTREAPTR